MTFLILFRIFVVFVWSTYLYCRHSGEEFLLKTLYIVYPFSLSYSWRNGLCSFPEVTHWQCRMSIAVHRPRRIFFQIFCLRLVKHALENWTNDILVLFRLLIMKNASNLTFFQQFKPHVNDGCDVRLHKGFLCI